LPKIVLTGYRGVGKTETGKKLAENLKLHFLDTDNAIEVKTGSTIHEIFQNEGEEAFRTIEKELINSLRTFHGVISTGGGVVLSPENIKALREDGIVILLTAGTKTILSRTNDNSRPKLTDLPLLEEIKKVLKERCVLYQAFSDICINTDDLTPDQVVEKIMQELSPVQRICGIACNPCGHSRSPELYNKLFSLYKLPYRYLRFENNDFNSIIENVFKLPLKGLTVTIPFKNTAVKYCDVLSKEAREIGAVNSIVRCENSLIGHNTDWKGIVEPLSSFEGANSVVIGAGGAAVAAVYGLLSMGIDVTVVNRTIEKAYKIRDQFHCKAADISKIGDIKPDLLINSTPLGMNGEGIPVNPDIINEEMTVFDLVYTPKETPLIKEAMKRGAKTIPGTEMFAVQAKHQFRLFTGIDVPLERIKEILT